MAFLLRSRSSFFLAMAALFLAMPAGATVVVMHSMAEMSARADVIIHARIADQRVIEDKGRIITLTDIEVIDAIKGAKKGDVKTIYQVGGTLNGFTAKIAGMHEHKIGDEMIFFAMNHKDMLVSYGVGVGKFRITHDDNANQVVEELTDIVVMRKGAQGKAEFAPPQGRNFKTLREFKRQIRSDLKDASRPKLMPLKMRVQRPARKGAN